MLQEIFPDPTEASHRKHPQKITEVRHLEIRTCLRVLQPPLIPDFDSLFKLREMFLVRHGDFRQENYAIFNELFPPRAKLLLRIP